MWRADPRDEVDPIGIREIRVERAVERANLEGHTAGPGCGVRPHKRNRTTGVNPGGSGGRTREPHTRAVSARQALDMRHRSLSAHQDNQQRVAEDRSRPRELPVRRRRQHRSADRRECATQRNCGPSTSLIRRARRATARIRRAIDHETRSERRQHPKPGLQSLALGTGVHQLDPPPHPPRRGTPHKRPPRAQPGRAKAQAVPWSRAHAASTRLCWRAVRRAGWDGWRRAARETIRRGRGCGSTVSGL